MSAAKPLASLSSSLLARKGGAHPAMRPQLVLSADEQGGVLVQMGGAAPAVDDLALNDSGRKELGEEARNPSTNPQSELPVIVQQLEALAAAVAEMPPLASPRRTKAGKEVRSALAEGRKAAFTLRVDQYRHLRLRLACTLQQRSAQSVLIEALDRFLADQPEVEILARRSATNR